MEIKRVLRLTPEETLVLRTAASTLQTIAEAVWEQKAVDEIELSVKDEILAVAQFVKYVMNGPDTDSSKQEG